MNARSRRAFIPLALLLMTLLLAPVVVARSARTRPAPGTAENRILIDPSRLLPGAAVTPAAATVTNAAELTSALRSGGAIRLTPGRYAGNFVVAVEGTTLLGRSDLANTRVQPGDVAGVVLAPADPLVPTLQVGPVRCIGRFTLWNGMPPTAAYACATGRGAWPVRQRVAWETKKLAKAMLGTTYLRVRKRILDARLEKAKS